MWKVEGRGNEARGERGGAEERTNNNEKSYGFGFVIFFGSLAILYKMFVNSSKHYVELKLGGLNNQILYMKKKEGAENLAFCIRKAMQDLHTPPDPGQSVAYAPVFPDPVLTRN